MGQRPSSLTPDKSPQHRLGYMIRELRTRRGYSLRELAESVYLSHSKLARWETGARPPQDRAEITLVDSKLRARGTLIAMWERTLDPASASHVSDADAHVSDSAGALVTPPQDPAGSDDGVYVPSRLRDGTVVFVQIDRRAFLRGGVGAGAGAAAALGVGTPASAGETNTVSSLVRRARAAASYGSTPLEHLRRTRAVLIDSDNLLGPGQAIKTAREYISVIQTLRRDATGPDAQGLLELQAQYAEFASWLYQDLGIHDHASAWLDRALQSSHTLGDTDLTAYVMARKAQLACDMRDVVDVVDLAEASHRTARPRSRLAAVAQTYQAYGHAIRGEAASSQRSIDRAYEMLTQTADDPSPWGIWFDASYIAVHRAQSLEVLGQHADAASEFEAAIGLLPDGYHRDRGVYLSRAAVAHAGAGAPEQAATIGLQALAIAEDTGSGRIVSELTRLERSLAPWQHLPEVNEYNDALDSVLVQPNEDGPR
ncbi:helix-turn-helix domain-containing protein [Embleya sp. NPDC020630]|uniref:helix-turn-helix domain-containing protein n=1 Tax=Embleya sp. NPDC020630 TaxID=3363979 RepID=UPI0037B52EBC